MESYFATKFNEVLLYDTPQNNLEKIIMVSEARH